MYDFKMIIFRICYNFTHETDQQMQDLDDIWFSVVLMRGLARAYTAP